MKKKIGGVVIVLLSTLSLPACTLMRSVGPCYGYGCHGSSAPQSGQTQNASSQTAPVQNAQSAVSQSNKPAAKKPHGFHGLLKKVKL
jgi:hypothetical protein